MKKFFTIFTFLILSCQLSWAQTAPDFTFTDIHGDTHNLQNALDQGYIVMIDFFFVDCGPCQATAPDIQSIHEDYAGKNFIIWSISDRDSDAYIDQYKTGAGLTYISGGSEGGGNDVINTYAGQFNFTGFPTFSIVCTDGTINWDIWPLTGGAQNLRDAIDACGVVDAAPYVPQNATAVTNISALENAILSPNPASVSSRLQFDLAESTDMSVSLMNAQGALIKNVFRGELPTGSHNFDIDLSDLPAASYWVRIQNGKGQTNSLAVQKF